MVQRSASKREIATPPRRGELVAAQIVHDLARGHLQFDASPESEVSLVARYQTSRGTLRDALRLLSLQGIVDIKHGATGGVVFRSPDPHHMATILSIALSLKGMSLATVLEARIVIEPVIAKLAAECCTDEDAVLISKALTDYDTWMALVVSNETASRKDLIAAHNNLHHIVASTTHNYILEVIEQQISHIIDRHSVYIRRDIHGLEETARVHHEICRAILDHRGGDAFRLIREEAQRFRDNASKTYPLAVEEPVRWTIDVSPY